MTLEQLLLAARRRLDDTRAPYLWSDDELTEFLNNAVDEACVRSQLIEDRTTPEVTRVFVDVSQVSNGYPLHSAIDRVTAAFWGTEDCALTPRSRADALLTVKNDTVVADPVDYPTAYYLERRKVYLVPPPATDGEVLLWVYRRPLAPLAALTDEPEIPEHLHRDLVWWVAYEAYSRKDADTQDADMADRAEAKFTARFGTARSAKVERTIQEMGAKTVYPRRLGGA